MISLTIKQLTDKLTKIKSLGFIKTHRAHDTGIGKTLEDLLGIEENNLQIPDVGEIEIKAKRLESGSMLTIATKSPEPRGVNKVLFEKCKYKDSNGEYSLHSTVYGSRVNPQGFRVVFKDEKLILVNKSNVDASWPIAIFNDSIKGKSDKILIAFADTKGEKKTLNEEFYYTEAFLLSGLNVGKFQKAIEEDKLKIDIRIGSFKSGKNKGKYHDHGTGFRINKKDFLHIFDEYTQII